MTYSFHPEARRELELAAGYYEGCATGLGFDFTLEVHNAIQRIADFPHAWEELRPGIRRCLLKRFPGQSLILSPHPRPPRRPPPQEAVELVLELLHGPRDPEWPAHRGLAPQSAQHLVRVGLHQVLAPIAHHLVDPLALVRPGETAYPMRVWQPKYVVRLPNRSLATGESSTRSNTLGTVYAPLIAVDAFLWHETGGPELADPADIRALLDRESSESPEP